MYLQCPQYHVQTLSSTREPSSHTTALPDAAQYKQHLELTSKVKDKEEILKKMAVGIQVQ